MNLCKIEHNSKKHAFTLLEMLIVLIIMWILLLFTIWLSGTQIQKIQNKLVKESIISELQTRYSRNLWSSSYAWVIYNYMDATITSWENNITFDYKQRKEGDPEINNLFTDKFIINKIFSDGNNKNESIILRYRPYQISCKIWKINDFWDFTELNTEKITLVANINDNQYYCFEIKQKNCRLTEVTCDSDWIE